MYVYIYNFACISTDNRKFAFFASIIELFFTPLHTKPKKKMIKIKKDILIGSGRTL